eukprot:TRINITY_DN1762_c0_g1_i2.p1 TRINITY_DN1762_c0_g1~~TRINITY_DN1762_c0_g1_i2.p1  ORF type:complete len:329 (+),score=56.16 TRINITY_DN1762_c0_g1_i2:91-1077(+)
MRTKIEVTGGHRAEPSADNVVTLMQMFPQLDGEVVAQVLRDTGTVERAVAALLNEAQEEDTGAAGDGDEALDIPSYLRCPKCFSPDLMDAHYHGTDEEAGPLLVCGNCHHHFAQNKAKKGAVHAVGGGAKCASQAGSAKAQKKRPAAPQVRGGRDRKGQKFDAVRSKLKQKEGATLEPLAAAQDVPSAAAAASESSASSTPSAAPLSPDGVPLASPCSPGDAEGRAMRKLMENRAVRAAQPTLRLCVSHAGSPKLKRVITIPMDERGWASLLQQARAKYNLRKPLKGARLMPEGAPLAPEDILSVPQGAEVSALPTNAGARDSVRKTS